MAQTHWQPSELADKDKKQLGDWAVEGRAEPELLNDGREEGGAKSDGASVVAWLVRPPA